MTGVTGGTVLYLRSRRVPAAALLLAVTAGAVWGVARFGDGAVDPRLVALAAAGGVTAASVGLAGQDPALDRTAALRWVPRRAGHVVLVAAAVALALLVAGAPGGQLGPWEVLVRLCAGSAGLAALAAACWGAQHAWVLPLGWFAVVLFAPVRQGFPDWILAPPGDGAAAWTATVLLAGGTATYAVLGPRR